MIDIYSKGEYPANSLSNFAEHPFTLDGMAIVSMEGFLQALKYRCPKKQAQICSLSGKQAKRAGKHKYLWRMTKTVFWNGQRLHLLSDELQLLIDRAYQAMYEQNPEFQQALLDTGGEELAHTIGKTRADKTILTEYQFVQHLYRLRCRQNNPSQHLR